MSESLGQGSAIVVDRAGDIVVGGQWPAAITNYDSSGNLLGTSIAGLELMSSIRGLAIHRDNEVLAVGATSYSAPHIDGQLVKYGPFGDVDWVRSLATLEHDTFTTVAIDHFGHIFASGWTGGTVAGTSSGSYDAVIRKYSAEGLELWTRQFGTFLGDHLAASVTDQDGNLYVAGNTEGSLFSVNASAVVCGGCYSSDAIVAKYSPDGQPLWARQFGGQWEDGVVDLALDSEGNLLLTGSTGGMFGEWAGPVDTFVSKLDSDGNTLWTRQFGTLGTDFTSAIAVDHYGDAYVTNNSYYLTLNGPPTDYDTLITKVSAAGVIRWQFPLATPQNDQALDIAVDNAGAIFITGYSNGNLGAGPEGTFGSFLIRLREVPEPTSTLPFLVGVIVNAFVRRRTTGHKHVR